MSVIKIHRQLRPGEVGCPICGLTGGFHKQPHFDVPSEYNKEKGWHKG